MSEAWITQLAADHAPPAAGWWPPALGWWGVAAASILFAALLVALVRWWREPQRRLRRAALRELRRIRASGMEGPVAARAIENLLRRHAIALHGSQSAARLTGGAWLEFAAQAGAPALAGETGRSLLTAAFGSAREPAAVAAERERWLAAASTLIRRSRRASAKERERT